MAVVLSVIKWHLELPKDVCEFLCFFTGPGTEASLSKTDSVSVLAGEEDS